MVEFDFCRAMTALCRDICSRHLAFRHISMQEVLVSIAQARRSTTTGRQAQLTPLRFSNGARVERRNGEMWAVQRLWHEGREMRYLLTFYLPRFQNQTFREKLITIFHELYHIHPDFTGDLRRFSGHCHLHSQSAADYDILMSGYVDEYLKVAPDSSLRSFLRLKFGSLEQRRGRVVGLRVPRPRLIPVPVNDAA